MDKRLIVRIVGAACGLLLGVLMLTIGFWRALLLGALAAAGWYLAGSTALRGRIAALKAHLKALRGGDRDI